MKAVSIADGISSPVWTLPYIIGRNNPGVYDPRPESKRDDPAARQTFIDVPETAYFAEAVNWAVENGIAAGTSDNTFSPESDCTRAQIVTFLWRAFGSPKSGKTPEVFPDIDADAYYADAVAWAVENGITAGTSDTTFSPNDICTRAQAVIFLWRAAGCPAASVGSPFADVEADAYYADAVAWALESGITSGTSETTFSPEQECTRAQIITFLWRSMK